MGGRRSRLASTPRTNASTSAATMVEISGVACCMRSGLAPCPATATMREGRSGCKRLVGACPGRGHCGVRQLPLRRPPNGGFVTPFFFSIPLAPKRDERSWRRISSLLADTLASLQQQTDGDWQAVIAGNEKPDIAEFDDPRVMFISVETRMPGAYSEKIADQNTKRAAAFEHIRRAGGGYVMMLDADDLVHRELVAFVRKDGNPFGYVFDQG